VASGEQSFPHNVVQSGKEDVMSEITNHGLSDYERDFFEAIDRNTAAEQLIFDALLGIDDEDYYTILEIEVEHLCGHARVQVFPERSGTLYRCLKCGVAGIIGG
jgi:hypothetical protein